MKLLPDLLYCTASGGQFRLEFSLDFLLCLNGSLANRWENAARDNLSICAVRIVEMMKCRVRCLEAKREVMWIKSSNTNGTPNTPAHINPLLPG